MSNEPDLKPGPANVSVEFYNDVRKLLNHRHPGREISTNFHLQLVIHLSAIDRVYQELPLETPKKSAGFAAAKRGET
ncbi:hypothetical protein [Blastopirellula retiformator]|uniref:Uncharacterized protein n=1 Tax=Blastopirellula retiformator TaxID=2527970 RepID=A0A5C5VKY6_9BACT|nr:hypothetical protein [Blastopirellula retiformator]TWT38701.1 hypothetical protein Enr8_03950 [Blastopirellula retiformator]